MSRRNNPYTQFAALPSGPLNPITDLDGFLFMYQSPGNRNWNTATGPDNGDGLTEYLQDAPNLIAANQGSALGNEFFVNNHATNIPAGEGYVVDDANKGLKYWNPGGGAEETVKVRMFGAGSETGLRHDQGEWTEVHGYFVTSGYGTNDDFRNDNNNVEHKLEGGNKWKHNDRYNDVEAGTGTEMNDGIAPDLLAPVANGSAFMFATARDLSGTYPCVNAQVPGTIADGAKNIQWVGQIAAGNTWENDVFQNDTLNESIVDPSSIDISPAYIDISNPRSDHSSNPKEYRYNELNILHFLWYTNRLATEQELKGIYEYLVNTFG